jgi:F0F1-type ATP synthase delta subunit
MRKKISKRAKESPVINLVWAEELNDAELKALRKMVEKAIKDPDSPIVSNYEIHWDRIRIDKKAVARVVWSNVLSDKDVDSLSNEVEKALKDPNYVIVVNYPVYWIEISK